MSANASFLLLPLSALLVSACGTGSEGDRADQERSTAGTGGASSAGTSAANGTTYNTANASASASTSNAGSGAATGAANTPTPGSAQDSEATDADPEASDAEGSPPGGGNMSNPGGTPPGDGNMSNPGGTPPGEDDDQDEDTDPVAPGAAAAPSLGSASRFAILGTSTVTCTNASAVGGDVGVSPGIAITGFDASCTLTGGLHAKDAIADAAHADLLVAFDSLAAVACETNLTGQELGGQTLAPGVYCFDTTAGITGELTLDAGGDADAVWIFQLGTALTTASGSAVTMAGGGNPCNVFWRIGSSATLGTTSSMQGNVLASASVTLTSGSSLVGRAMAVNAAVTSDGNAVSSAACSR